MSHPSPCNQRLQSPLHLVTPLHSAFNIQLSALVSIVGGGGKTSLMFALAKSLPGGVIVTTTTRIFAAQIKLAEKILTAEDAEDAEKWREALSGDGVCLVIGAVEGEKAFGVPLALPGELLARPGVNYVVVEADGSRMRPIKAPADHEPVIPPESTLVIPVVGIDALNGRLQEVAHRPERVADLLGRHLLVNSEPLSAKDIAALLIHPQGGLKHVPEGAQAIPLVNKVETAEQLAQARQIACLTLHEPRIKQVVIGAVRSQQPVKEVMKRVTAVVLAAGEGKRMGQTKQLLSWGETTVLGQTLRNLKNSLIHNILVVSGHEAEKIEAIAREEGISTLYNPQYAAGEMLSSLQTAVSQLPTSISAVLVVLADQPMIEPETINQLLFAYWQGKGELIAPVFEGQRGNPVLIGRSHFAELLTLPSGAAPRDLLRRHQDEICLLSVASDTILRDIDSPEQYQRWRPSFE